MLHIITQPDKAHDRLLAQLKELKQALRLKKYMQTLKLMYLPKYTNFYFAKLESDLKAQYLRTRYVTSQIVWNPNFVQF